MSYFSAALRLPVLVMLLLTSSLGWADFKTQTDIEDVEIHYVIFPSSMIAPETANALGLTRHSNIQFINVSVRKKQPDGSTIANPAVVGGEYSDLIHRRPLEFIEVKETGAIYYLSPIRFPGEDAKMTFSLDVKYDDKKPATKIEFVRTLYRDIK
ncbi:hypothetical protein SIN8267_03082 [Sinobacterium norvegicum]|uniref:DUF4426 domain-containing protein n=1 Tax=Sinobacterium norvegicum TaxID=1641715 RepID=A0ABM9AIR4_9GAMM|nr:DUF4426 domain-containing protein [Sinobacterium norvegicum]CAH0992943.1 hypothetical protein SIN8267_03082 [Sinobacterium norvegicum]